MPIHMKEQIKKSLFTVIVPLPHKSCFAFPTPRIKKIHAGSDFQLQMTGKVANDLI